MVSVSYAQSTQEPWLVTLTVELMNAQSVKILTKLVTVSLLELPISQFKTLELVNATNFSLLMIQEFVKIAQLTLEHKTTTSSVPLMAAHKMQLLMLLVNAKPVKMDISQNRQEDHVFTLELVQ